MRPCAHGIDLPEISRQVPSERGLALLHVSVGVAEEEHGLYGFRQLDEKVLSASIDHRRDLSERLGDQGTGAAVNRLASFL